MMYLHEILTFMFFTYFLLLHSTNCESQSGNYFLKAAKNVPRIGRSNNQKTNTNVDEMGKFFMKASKSVPRIGRRNQELEKQHQLNVPYPYMYDQPAEDQPTEKRAYYPMWNQIADRFEYDPELFSSSEALQQLEQEMGDDPAVYYDWNHPRMKRSNTGINRERTSPNIA